MISQPFDFCVAPGGGPMIQKRFVLVLLAISFFCGIARTITTAKAQESKDDIGRLLKEKYSEGSFIVFRQSGLYAGEYDSDNSVADKIRAVLSKRMGFPKYRMSAEYHHYFTPSDKSKGDTPLDDGKTFSHLRDVGYKSSPIEPLEEKLRILELKIEKDQIGFYLEADQQRHGGSGSTSKRRTEIETGGSKDPTKIHTRGVLGQWGIAYIFKFPKEIISRGDGETILSEISRVLLPTKEYIASKQTETKVSSKPTTKRDQEFRKVESPKPTEEIEVKVGMTREHLIKALGQPQKAVKFGRKEILTYPDLKVTLINGKVSSVQ
jgi:hypothetical protein